MRPPLRLSPLVLAEVDYLPSTRIGVDAELDHEIGLAEASLAVLEARHETRDVRALDRRLFGTLNTLERRPRAFRALP